MFLQQENLGWGKKKICIRWNLGITSLKTASLILSLKCALKHSLYKCENSCCQCSVSFLSRLNLPRKPRWFLPTFLMLTHIRASLVLVWNPCGAGNYSILLQCFFPPCIALQGCSCTVLWIFTAASFLCCNSCKSVDVYPCRVLCTARCRPRNIKSTATLLLYIFIA